jgi:GT2 family glycosyltransferase
LSPLSENSIIDVSAVVATAGRSAALTKTLRSLSGQTVHPSEIIIVDASNDSETRQLCEAGFPDLRSEIRWIAAAEAGAAVQRNQGVSIATQEVIWFFDDDLAFEQDCVSNLWKALLIDVCLGGVNAMITNQHYEPPGFLSRLMFSLMSERAEKCFAGKVIGPGINLLPEDRDDLPNVVPMEWLNTTCTMYRREALPSPPFDPFFTDYSLMEDLALSLTVGQNGWKLANARTARIYHDSQSSDHKEDATRVASMELINRHYIMTKVLQRKGLSNYTKLAAWEVFSLASLIPSRTGRMQLAPSLLGKCKAVAHLMRSRSTVDE